MPVTLQDVAARAGVSKSAVSRTFTPGASVSATMRLKVETAARELGYRTNVLASSLTTGRTRLIGLISNNFANPYFLQIFDAFTRALQRSELRPLILNLSEQEDAGQSLAMLQQYNVDGVIVASSTLPPQFSAAFQRAGIPVVHAFGWSSPAPETALVGIDNTAAGRLAGDTLLARGYRRIGFLGGPEQAATTQDRLAGLRAGLEPHGVTPCVCFADDYSYDAGLRAMTAALDTTDVEAWFCGDDIIAVGALDAARAAHYSVPGDLGLLGLNDMAIAAWRGIGLTSISQPLDQIVDAAIDLIQHSMDDPQALPAPRLLPFGIVERGSLRPLP